MQLYTKILLGLGLGTLAGLAAKLRGMSWLADALIFIEPIGTLFIRLITMIVIPLVVASLLILGVDRILDMLRSAVNVTGDLSCAAFVARIEGERLTPEAAV